VKQLFIAALIFMAFSSVSLEGQTSVSVAPQSLTAPKQSSVQPVPPTTPALPSASGQNASPAQQPQEQEQQESEEYVIKRTVNEVNLIFTVTDQHGHFINNLRQQDFSLRDDRRLPEKVSSFAQQSNLPLRMGVLIDASTSIQERFQFEQQATTEFLLQSLKSRNDRAFVMGFDANPVVVQDWTNNMSLLQTGINKLHSSGGTALFDAVYSACRDKFLHVSPGGEPVRKAMIVISDGDDNQSRVYLKEAIQMCQSSGTTIYTISTNTSPMHDRGDAVLQMMSDATGGGPTFFPFRIEDITSGFRKIGDALRSQYAMTYIPADFEANGAFRSIYLQPSDPKSKYVVRAPKGYFAIK
jgi:Ca-activated chloride channel homolog